MHSSWKIWDLVKSRPEIIDKDGPRFIVIQTWDSFAFKIIKDKIPKSLFSENKLLVKSSKEVTPFWIEDNLKSLGLFGNSESYLFLEATSLNKQTKEALTNIDELIVDDRYVILEYSKEDDLLKKIKTHPKVELIKVQAPGFWEFDKLLDFLCDELRVYLDISAKDLILNNVASEVASFYNILSQISINFPGKVNLSAREIEPLLQGIKTDQFELANDFASKKIKLFYEKVSKVTDFNDLRQIFMFLQSHLLKVLDTEYTSKKARLTKYDKEIISQSKIWKSSELDRALKYFSKLEILAKKKDPLLFNTIQQGRLRVL